MALSAQTGIPATPAGQALRAWLEAYNSGERKLVEVFVQKVEPTVSADLLMALNDHITFAARQAGSDRPVIGELTVATGKSVEIERLNFIGLKQQ